MQERILQRVLTQVSNRKERYFWFSEQYERDALFKRRELQLRLLKERPFR
jgi:hypothetical protein